VNSDVAPAKTALSTDPSQRAAVLLVAGAGESFSYVLRASTRDLSARSIQSALNRWADGLAKRAQSRRDAVRLTATSTAPNYGPTFAQASNDTTTAARALSQECPAAELPRAGPGDISEPVRSLHSVHGDASSAARDFFVRHLRGGSVSRWRRGTGRSVGVSPSASYATAPISHACPCVGTVCGTDKSGADVEWAWPKGVDAQQQWVQHRSSNRPEKTDIHDIDSRVSNIIMYAI
jgi:hypothetical protein